MYATTRRINLEGRYEVASTKKAEPKLEVIDTQRVQESQRLKNELRPLIDARVPKHFHSETYLSLETQQGTKEFANLEPRALFRLLNENSQVAQTYAGCVDELADQILDNLKNQGNARIAYDSALKLSEILNPNAILSKEKTMCLELSFDTIKTALGQPTDAIDAIQEVRSFANVAKQYASAYKIAQLRY